MRKMKLVSICNPNTNNTKIVSKFAEILKWNTYKLNSLNSYLKNSSCESCNFKNTVYSA